MAKTDDTKKTAKPSADGGTALDGSLIVGAAREAMGGLFTQVIGVLSEQITSTVKRNTGNPAMSKAVEGMSIEMIRQLEQRMKTLFPEADKSDENTK